MLETLRPHFLDKETELIFERHNRLELLQCGANNKPLLEFSNIWRVKGVVYVQGQDTTSAPASGDHFQFDFDGTLPQLETVQLKQILRYRDKREKQKEKLMIR